jgi:hypothetical protein
MRDQTGFDANFLGVKSPKFGIVSELAHGFAPFFRGHQYRQMPPNCGPMWQGRQSVQGKRTA